MKVAIEAACVSRPLTYLLEAGLCFNQHELFGNHMQAWRSQDKPFDQSVRTFGDPRLGKSIRHYFLCIENMAPGDRI